MRTSLFQSFYPHPPTPIRISTSISLSWKTHDHLELLSGVTYCRPSRRCYPSLASGDDGPSLSSPHPLEGGPIAHTYSTFSRVGGLFHSHPHTLEPAVARGGTNANDRVANPGHPGFSYEGGRREARAVTAEEVASGRDRTRASCIRAQLCVLRIGPRIGSKKSLSLLPRNAK